MIHAIDKRSRNMAIALAATRSSILAWVPHLARQVMNLNTCITLVTDLTFQNPVPRKPKKSEYQAILAPL